MSTIYGSNILTYIIRIACLTAISALAGMVIGVGQIRAETTGANYVDQYGNVLIAITTGGAMNPGSYGTGASTTTASLYYLKADARAWHLGAIDEESIDDCANCQNATTNQVSSGTYDAFVATQSHAHAQGSFGNSYYTSVYPHGARSCYTYWSSGSSC